MQKLIHETILIIALVLLACNNKIDKSKWPFPDPVKCASYYKSLSGLGEKLAEIDSLEIKLPPVGKNLDSLRKHKIEMDRLTKMYADSAEYFNKLR